MNLLHLLIEDEKSDYKCFDLLKELITKNDDFRKTIEIGIQEGKVKGFDKNLWQKISDQNIRGINSFEDVFSDGANLGYCTVAAKQLSYSLNKCYLCGGVLPILENTENCKDGSHTWILYENTIIDTSLMLVIDKDYASKIGYIEENRYDPNIDPIYIATKEFTNDKSIKEGRTK